MDKIILNEVWDDFFELIMIEFRNVFGFFLFKGDDVFKDINKLSGGERCRINFLKLMLFKLNFFFLDEFINYLDIFFREVFEDVILSYDGILIVIFYDRYFLNKVIYRILELEENGVNEYFGNYNYYIEKKKNF